MDLVSKRLVADLESVIKLPYVTRTSQQVAGCSRRRLSYTVNVTVNFTLTRTSGVDLEQLHSCESKVKFTVKSRM